jgi:hypothetical protein
MLMTRPRPTADVTVVDVAIGRIDGVESTGWDTDECNGASFGSAATPASAAWSIISSPPITLPDLDCER